MVSFARDNPVREAFMMQHALLKASALLLGLPLVCISTSALSLDARSFVPSGRAGVIQVAENEQCVYRCRIVREECADDSKRASRPDAACWTTYGQCRTDCGEAPSPAEETKVPPAAPAPPAAAPAPARAPAERTLTPRIITVGKWAEGIGFDGTSLWVAESGQRTIAQVNVESGKVVRHVTVGRFPVGMTSAADGSIYTLLQTDKLIWLQSPGKASGRALASDLEGCPNGIARADDGVLWVLTWPACSSDSGKVIRLNPNGGGRTASKVFGEYGEGIAAFGGKAWVAHSRGPALTVVDEHMAVREGNVRGASLKPITSNSIGVYAGGSIGENTMQGLVVSINPNTLQEARRSAVNERIAAIAADDSNVVAMGVGGRIWVYSAERLVLQRTVRLSTGGFEPHALSIVGDRLFISKSEHQGENGAVLVLTGWR
jgi:hypothetical protein